MSFTEAIRHCFVNYANFTGRASRSEFWYFTLFNVIAATVLTAISVYLGSMYSLAALLPTLGVSCRRLHDTGKSGWWLLASLIPLVGEILLIVWFCQEGNAGSTAFPPAAQFPSAGMPYVECLAGPMQGQRFPVGAQGLLFGRTDACHVRFPEGTPGISAMHCRLTLDTRAGTATITDLGSSFGTFLEDGRQLPTNYPHPLGIDCFYLGSRKNLFRFVIR